MGLRCRDYNKTSIYDATNDTWTIGSNTNFGRHGTSLITMKNRLFAAGGFGPDWINTNVVEEYSPSTNTW